VAEVLPLPSDVIRQADGSMMENASEIKDYVDSITAFQDMAAVYRHKY
jgi:hypothetical protein